MHVSTVCSEDPFALASGGAGRKRHAPVIRCVGAALTFMANILKSSVANTGSSSLNASKLLPGRCVGQDKWSARAPPCRQPMLFTQGRSGWQPNGSGRTPTIKCTIMHRQALCQQTPPCEARRADVSASVWARRTRTPTPIEASPSRTPPTSQQRARRRLSAGSHLGRWEFFHPLPWGPLQSRRFRQYDSGSMRRSPPGMPSGVLTASQCCPATSFSSKDMALERIRFQGAKPPLTRTLAPSRWRHHADTLR